MTIHAQLFSCERFASQTVVMATILYERYNVAQINEPVHANEELVLLHNALCRRECTFHKQSRVSQTEVVAVLYNVVSLRK